MEELTKKKFGEMYADKVDEWHSSDSNLTLQEYLELSDLSYHLWIRDPLEHELFYIVEGFKDEFIRNRELIFNHVNGFKQALVFCNQDFLDVAKKLGYEDEDGFLDYDWKYCDWEACGKADLIFMLCGIVFHLFLKDVDYPVLKTNTFIEIRES